jgi:hypothetical protein
MIAHMTPIPRIEPVRVVNITSPEPIISEDQINPGPIIAKTAQPLGADLGVSTLYSSCR